MTFYVNQRVMHKEHGWTGTIVDVEKRHQAVTVEWDHNEDKKDFQWTFKLTSLMHVE